MRLEITKFPWHRAAKALALSALLALIATPALARGGHHHRGGHGLFHYLFYPAYHAYHSYHHYRHHYPYRYGYHHRHYYPGPRYHKGSKGSGSQGAVDLNIRPRRTEIYLNGRYVGVADNFDGLPRYLWLPEGKHELIFYREGYETVVRNLTVAPYEVLDLRINMQPGETIAPEELTAYDPTLPVPTEEPPSSYASPSPAPTPTPRPSGGGALDARQAPAEVSLTVTPGDASIYLDGRFIGTGDSLASSGGALLVDPGEHLMEVVRPGYESRELRFQAEAGGEVSLEVGRLSKRP